MALLNKSSDNKQIKGNSCYDEKPNVFISGHTGFIGSHLIKRLENDFNLIMNSKNGGKRINILDRKQFSHIHGADVIIHLAGKTSIPESILNPYDTYYTNIIGTLNILDFAVEKKIRNIINISTYVYGNPKYIPIDEAHPINPHSSYNKSKLISETLCNYYSQDHNINIVTLRPFYIYGPSTTSTFISSVIQKIAKDEKIILSGKNIRRDFLYISDFVDLIYKILMDFPKGYSVYNIGYGKSYSLEDILKIIEIISNKIIAVEYDNSIRPHDVVEMVADIDKAKKAFNWKPVIDIEDGLKLTLRNRPN